MQVHQLSFNYVPTQDRILARINTTAGEELRVWLTRRLCLNLWPSLNKSVAEHVTRQRGAKGLAQSPLATADDMTRQMMADFERHESLQNADFKTPYKAQPSLLPLGDDPLLVTQIKITPLDSGALQLDFQEKLSGQTTSRGFKMDMVSETLHGFVHLLDQALARSGWLGDPAAPTPDPLPTMAGDRPKYLN